MLKQLPNILTVSRIILLPVLIGLFFVPVVAAYIAYLGWRPSAHGNYGELLRVTPLQQTAGARPDGEALDFTALRSRGG